MEMEEQTRRWIQEMNDEEEEQQRQHAAFFNEEDSDSESDNADGVLNEYIPYSIDQPSEQKISSSDDDGPVGDVTCSISEERKRSRSVSGLVPTYTGRDKQTTWLMHPRKTSLAKKSSANVIRECPGPRGAAKSAKDNLSSWKIFFPDSVISQIVLYTNQKLETMSVNYSNPFSCRPTDDDEVRAVIGILYLMGVLKSRHTNLRDLWATDGTAPEIYRAVMPMYRFRVLLIALRLDDATTRKTRQQQDHLAPIREIFDDFVSTCQRSFSMSENVTIDEMLVGFRGRCKFLMHMPNIPERCGIKIWALCDAKLFYTSNLEVYCGSQPSGTYQLDSNPTEIVKRLIQPIDKSGRNVSMDSYFSSVKLFNDLYANHRLKSVGTLRKNTKEIPDSFSKPIKERRVGSSQFAFGRDQNKCTLLSYKAKKNKEALLLSTLHNDDSLHTPSNKPEIIKFYNMTKGGVDVVERLKSEYAVGRISNRWPMAIFCFLLNIGAINAHIILAGNTLVRTSRREYLKELAFELCRPHMRNRLYSDAVKFPTRQFLSRFLNLPIKQNDPVDNENMLKKKTTTKCDYCPKKKNRYTGNMCVNCQKYVCGDHMSPICCDCTESSQYYDLL